MPNRQTISYFTLIALLHIPTVGELKIAYSRKGSAMSTVIIVVGMIGCDMQVFMSHWQSRSVSDHT